MGVFADAGKNVEHFAAGRGGMLHTVGREQRKPMMLRQLDQVAVDTFFAPDEMSLQLDINAIGCKSFEQPLQAVVIVLRSTGRWPAAPGGSPDAFCAQRSLPGKTIGTPDRM